MVDDASEDRTVETVRDYMAQMGERLRLIRHEANQGVGGAIATGYEWRCDHEIDVMADAGGAAT